MSRTNSDGVDIVRVERIDRVGTGRPDTSQYTVTAVTYGAPRAVVQYQTVNPYLAELCEWGRQTEWPLELTWRRSAYGRDLVGVEKVNYQ